MTVHAPFNFVPLSNFVYATDQPEDVARISHDIPFAEGISGEFDITITAHSEVLIGGKRGNHPKDNIQTVEPFQLPDGTYAIPERTLRGMVRNVLEIAAFGQMKFVDAKRFGIRDLTDAAMPYYRDRIVNKVAAGWLWFDGRGEKPGWKITPCDFARVAFAELDAIKARSGIKSDINWKERKDAEVRYKAWGADKTAQTLMVDGRFASLPVPGDPDVHAGFLVFTGNSGIKDPAKKAEFFFYNSVADEGALAVDPAVFGAFKDIHAPDDGRPPNPTWRYWEPRWSNDYGTRIPVFYIRNKEQQVESFGLAMMFKLAHENSVRQVIEHSSADHGAEGKIDLPTAIFGAAADEGKADADGKKPLSGLKSRVHLGLAKCVGPTSVIEEQVTILAGPKPSYFPAYIRQPVATEKNDGMLKGGKQALYATYTPLPDRPEPELRWPEIRGWKRYPVGRPVAVVDARNNPNAKVKVHLRPLRRGTVFTSRVRFHNLRPVELGALLWALEWGGNPKLRHRLGMGKPYGYGEMTISIEEASWVTAGAKPTIRRNKDGAQAELKEHYVGEFTIEMERAYKQYAGRNDCSWAKSEQLCQLRAMADPERGAAKASETHPHAARGHDVSDIKHGGLDYMLLDTRVTNEFAEAKRRHETLPQYIALTRDECPQREHEIWPRKVPAAQHANSSAPKGATNDDATIRVGDIVIYTEWEELVRIKTIKGDQADVESLHGDERANNVPFSHLKKQQRRR